jgi:uncharacterized protein YndB with AHSA1/START domain
MRPGILLLVALLTPAWVMAEVADSSPGGFTVKFSLPMHSTPAQVYAALIQVGNWWDPAHTFSGDAHNLSIDEKAGGCFCEKLPDHGSVRHLEVLTVMPGKRLVMSGGLGPLQSIAASGSMTLQITAAGAGAKLDVVYTVAGYLPAGMNTWAPRVDAMLQQQLGRLGNYIEKGKP